MAQLKAADFLPQDEIVRPPLPYFQEAIPSSEFNIEDYETGWEFTSDEDMTSTPVITKFYSYINNTTVESIGYGNPISPGPVDDSTDGLVPYNEEPETLTTTTLSLVSLISSGWGTYDKTSRLTPPYRQWELIGGSGVAVELLSGEGSLEYWGIVGE